MSEIKKQNEIVKQEVKGALSVMEKDIADAVFNRVNEMESSHQLMFPANYAVGNALKSAYLIIRQTVDRNKQPVLQSCTKESIANALLDMVIQGLNPAKKQCYFIPYGNSLDMSRSYFGDQVAVMNALNLEKKPYSTCVYKDDVFEVGYREDDGELIVTKHETKFENRNKPIVGAYAILYTNDGVKHYEIMTWEEIQKAWAKSKVPNNSTHKDYPQEMSRRTVLRRLAKHWMNTSDDANLFVVESYNRTTENDYDNSNDYAETAEDLQYQVEVEANSEELIIEGEAEYMDESEQQPEEAEVIDGPGF